MAPLEDELANHLVRSRIALKQHEIRPCALLSVKSTHGVSFLVSIYWNQERCPALGRDFSTVPSIQLLNAPS
jgi:hypothetical protein